MYGDNILVTEDTVIHHAAHDMISDNVTDAVMNINPNSAVVADIETQKSVDKVADAVIDMVSVKKLSQEIISSSNDTLKLVISHVSSFQTVIEAEDLAVPQQTHDDCDVNINHVDLQSGAVRDITKLEQNKVTCASSDDIHRSDSLQAQNTVNMTSLITSRDCSSSLGKFSVATDKTSFMEKEIPPSCNTIIEIGTSSQNNEAPQVVYVDLDVSNESSSKHDEEHNYNLKIKEIIATNVLKPVTMENILAHSDLSHLASMDTDLSLVSMDTDTCHLNAVSSEVNILAEPLNILSEGQENGTPIEKTLCGFKSKSCVDQERMNEKRDNVCDSCNGSQVLSDVHFENNAEMNIENKSDKGGADEFGTDGIMILDVRSLSDLDVECISLLKDFKTFSEECSSVTVTSNVEHLPVISNVVSLNTSDSYSLSTSSELCVNFQEQPSPISSEMKTSIFSTGNEPSKSVDNINICDKYIELVQNSEIQKPGGQSQENIEQSRSTPANCENTEQSRSSPTNCDSLLVISSAISVKNITIKEEPADDGQYGRPNAEPPLIRQAPNVSKSHIQPTARSDICTLSAELLSAANNCKEHAVSMSASQAVRVTAVVPADTALCPQVVPTALALHPQVVPKAVALHPQVVPTAVALHPQVVPTAVALHQQVVPTAVALHPQVVPTAVALHSQVVPTAVALHPQVVPTAVALHPQVVPTAVALHPQVVPTAIAPPLCIFPTMNNVTTINSVQTVTSTNGNLPSILDDVNNGKEGNKNGTCTAVIRTTVPPPKKILILPKEDSLHYVINIKTVGVQKITEMIARKNPIPTYKPTALPLSLKNDKNLKTYSCYECGDQFHFETSYNIHFSRRSMSLSYKCEKCGKLEFTNKCQLLSHLRSHMNIEKTQAVPIHIKSDSIEIKTLYDDIAAAGKYFQWYDDEKDKCNEPAVSKDISCITSNAVSQSTEKANALTCSECNLMFGSADERKDHFQPCQGLVHYCDVCAVYTRSSCSLKAHKRIHDLCQESVSSNYNFKDAKVCSLLTKLICPECGLLFPTNNVAEKFIAAHIENFFLHLKTKCFHLSRLASFKCPKCNTVFNSLNRMRRHICVTLDHYYKCGLCPMALKAVKSFEQHFSLKHKKQENVTDSSQVPVKIIYRCHVCDTLIDDKSFLVSHNEKHIGDITINPLFFFHCLQCSQLFEEKSKLDQHYQLMHQSVKRHWSCAHCRWTQLGNMFKFVSHVLNYHTHKDSCEKVIFCDICGLVCLNAKVLQTHDCLYKCNGFQIMGDKEAMKTKESVAGQHAVKTKEDLFEPSSIPSHLSPHCRSCGKKFYSQDMRASHLKDHHADKEYICVSCDAMNFKSFHDFRSHEILCTEMRKVPGPKCEDLPKDNSVIASTRKSPKKRKHTDVTDIPYCCEKCSETFCRKSQFDEHVKSEHGIHPCHLCGLMHESQSSLKRHLLLDHEGKMFLYYCGVCKNRKLDKSFAVRAKLEKHLRTKHRMKTIDESKIITKLPGLPEETSKELAPETLKRTFADETISSDTVKSVKKLRVHGEKLLKCAKCLYMCENRSTFQEHIAEHKTPNTCQCFECGLCFAVLPSLKMHLFMVHKIRDFDSYLEENNIEVPSNQDTDTSDDIEREPIQDEIFEESEEEIGNPLECKVCYKEFDHVTSLHSHMRIHGMAFIKKSRRRGHISPIKQAMSVGTETPGKMREGLVLKIKKLKTVSPFKERTSRKTLQCEDNEIDNQALKLDSADADLNIVDINESIKSGFIENNQSDLIKD